MRVSVIGCGNIAQVHLEILNSMEGIEISSVTDIVEEKADKVLIGAFGAYRAQGGYIFLAA